MGIFSLHCCVSRFYIHNHFHSSWILTWSVCIRHETIRFSLRLHYIHCAMCLTEWNVLTTKKIFFLYLLTHITDGIHPKSKHLKSLSCLSRSLLNFIEVHILLYSIKKGPFQSLYYSSLTNSRPVSSLYSYYHIILMWFIVNTVCEERTQHPASEYQKSEVFD